MSAPASIHAAICGVMAAVGYAQKTGTATFGERYSYASEGDLIRALRPAMVEHGLYLRVDRVERVELEHFPTRRGAQQLRCDVTVTYLLTHAASGETITIQSIGSGIDSGDKAPYKAMTGALKYALRQTFLIETGDDPEAGEDPDEGTDERPATRRPAKRPASRRAAEPPSDPAPHPVSADNFRALWFANLSDAGAADLTDDERHSLQRALWGVANLGDLSAEQRAEHADRLRQTPPEVLGRLADEHRASTPADPPEQGEDTDDDDSEIPF